jgi:hypothetical protein
VAEEGLPPSVSQFIGQYVRSVEQLEIILLLARNPEETFSVQDVYRVIMSTVESVQGWLDEMVIQGLAAQTAGPPPTFRFLAANFALQEAVKSLGASYKAYPVRVIECIYRPRQESAPAPPSDPAQGFADAFRLRKD